jgi:Ca-activated chloride channel family protein
MERLIEIYRNKGIFICGGFNGHQDDKMIIADKGNGNYGYIDNLMEGRKYLGQEFTRLFTIAKDAKIQIESNRLWKEYRRLENRIMNEKFLVTKGRRDVLTFGTALYEIVLPIKLVMNGNLISAISDYSMGGIMNWLRSVTYKNRCRQEYSDYRSNFIPQGHK